MQAVSASAFGSVKPTGWTRMTPELRSGFWRTDRRLAVSGHHLRGRWGDPVEVEWRGASGRRIRNRGGRRLSLFRGRVPQCKSPSGARGIGTGCRGRVARGAVNVASEDGASFLKEVLPAELAASFDFAVVWREDEGLRFLIGDAGADLQLTFPLDLDLGIIYLLELLLGLVIDGSTTVLEAGLTGSVKLGPVKGVVENVGVEAVFTPAGTQLGFRAPDGLGLVIDADVVTGGGFLYHDKDKGEYAGAVQIEALGLGLGATGILLTKFEGGDWSLIVTIAATFTGVQLGFGFTLDGVGGLLGIHRSFATEVLQAGLRDGSLDAVLYPDDPVGDAPLILDTLAAAFPPVQDQYVFGPTVKIGWAGMLSAEPGVIFEIPDPVKVALLGQLEIGMPFLGSPLVEIHMDTLGVLDLGAGSLAVDTSIYDSNVVGFALQGDVAIRMNWLGQPSFTLAVGGFHPAYPAPVGFPTLRRMSISLDTGGNPLISLDGYFALTSNSVQFGAHFNFFTEMAAFTIEAWAGFDVLVLFSPFQLSATLDMGATVAAAGVTPWGVDLTVTVSGPKPWEVCGSASFKLLGVKTEFNIDLTLPPHGEPEEIEAVDASEIVLESLSNPQNWVPALPEGEVAGVVFALAFEVGDGPLVHPGGRVEIRQKACRSAKTWSWWELPKSKGPTTSRSPPSRSCRTMDRRRRWLPMIGRPSTTGSPPVSSSRCRTRPNSRDRPSSRCRPVSRSAPEARPQALRSTLRSRTRWASSTRRSRPPSPTSPFPRLAASSSRKPTSSCWPILYSAGACFPSSPE